MFKGVWLENTNMLGLVIFSIVMGVAIACSGEHGRPLLHFFESMSNVMSSITSWIIYLAPVGICFLVAGQILEMKNIWEDFSKLGWFVFTVILGLLVHGLVVLPLIFTIITHSLPFG